jgi:hypothetical protein
LAALEVIASFQLGFIALPLIIAKIATNTFIEEFCDLLPRD